jgi:hypothetical protein
MLYVAHNAFIAEALSICVYELHDNKRRVLITDANKATNINLQFKNDDDDPSRSILKLRGGQRKDFNQYVKA